MIYEVEEIITTHLRESAYSVNALKPSVPLGVFDPPTEDVTVQSEFDVNWLPGGEIPQSAYADGPLILVRRGDAPGEFSPPGNPEIADDESRLTIAAMVLFPRRQNRAFHQEQRYLSALLRVVRRSLGHLFETVPLADRNLRDVQLTGLLGSIRVQPTMGLIGERDLVAGAVLLDLDVLDRWAELIT